jgi:hypothetical protein
MSCNRTQTWYRGESRELVLTISVDGEAVDLSSALAIEYQLKEAPGAADPPLIALALGTGISLRPQSGATLGQADVAIPYTATDVLTARTYYEEVAAMFPGTPPIRRYVVPPRKVFVLDVVNRP